jgi:ATP-binding cassette subfamily C protein
MSADPTAPPKALDSFAKVSGECWRMLDGRTRRRIPMLLVLMMVASVVEALGLGIIFPLTKLMVAPESADGALAWLRQLFGDASPKTMMMGLAGGVVGLFLAKNALTVLSTVVLFRYRVDAEIALTRSLMKTYLESPLALLLRRNSAELSVKFTNTIPYLFVFVLLNIAKVSADLLLIAAVVAVLVAADPIVAMAVLAVFIVTLTAIFMVIRRRLRAWGAAQLDLIDQRQQCLQQSFGALREIKVMGAENYFVAAYAGILGRLMPVQMRIQVGRDIPRIAIEAVLVVTMAAIILGMLASGRDSGDVVSVLGLFAAAGFRLLPQINRVYGSINELRINWSAIERIGADFRGFHPESDFAVVPPTVRRSFTDEIRFENVSFVYPLSHQQVLDDLNFTIRRGQWVALVGRSGSGKTTTADLLMGLLDCSAGRILVDGADIRGNLRPWQNAIGMVPQTIYLNDDSIRNNVAFATRGRDIDDDAVRRALTLAQLDEFVDKLDAPVGERGGRLSGGQRQRLGIARALYRDPDVLVLDEATSALDVETEQEVINVLAALAGRLTIVTIAHRLSTVKRCDNVLFLDGGRLAGSGRFNDLRRKSPDFARMVSLASADIIDDFAGDPQP